MRRALPRIRAIASARVAAAGVALAFATALAGCASSAPSGATTPVPGHSNATLSSGVPDPTLDAGWTEHADAAEGYAIGFPDTWDFVFRSSPTFSADIQGIARVNADLATYFSDGFQKSAPGGLKLIAAEPRSVQSGFVTNLNVFKTDLGPSGQALDLDSISAAKQDLIKKDPGTDGDVKHQRIQVPAGSMEQIQYSMKPNGKSVAVSSYLGTADIGGNRFLFEIISGSTVSDYASLFDHLAKSFRVTGTAAGASPQGSPSTH